jgi:hypothetical protein
VTTFSRRERLTKPRKSNEASLEPEARQARTTPSSPRRNLSLGFPMESSSNPVHLLALVPHALFGRSSYPLANLSHSWPGSPFPQPGLAHLSQSLAWLAWLPGYSAPTVNVSWLPKRAPTLNASWLPKRASAGASCWCKRLFYANDDPPCFFVSQPRGYNSRRGPPTLASGSSNQSNLFTDCPQVPSLASHAAPQRRSMRLLQRPSP